MLQTKLPGYDHRILTESDKLLYDQNKKKKYWSTSFNIHKLISEIGKIGKIDQCVVAKQEGKLMDFDSFSVGRTGECRTGDYLVISGTS